VQQYREEPKLYDKLAKTYAAQGKIALQHMALAESYVLGGALPAAVDQLNLARKAKDVSFYDQARDRCARARADRSAEGREAGEEGQGRKGRPCEGMGSKFGVAGRSSSA
jgi:predicted Zn-dependent protease